MAGRFTGTGYSKFRAQKTKVDNITFHSKKEAEDYKKLKILLQSGEIKYLELQPKFELRVNGDLICRYIADFRYERTGSDKVVVRDTKGMKTPEFRIKEKLFRALYPDIEYEVI